jgi:hypothetical protein
LHGGEEEYYADAKAPSKDHHVHQHVSCAMRSLLRYALVMEVVYEEDEEG